MPGLAFDRECRRLGRGKAYDHSDSFHANILYLNMFVNLATMIITFGI
jgi:5-formyltetrahydrofolate cyclo-ligase